MIYSQNHHNQLMITLAMTHEENCTFMICLKPIDDPGKCVKGTCLPGNTQDYTVELLTQQIRRQQLPDNFH